MKNFRLLSLLGVILVTGTLAGCLDNNNVNEWSNNQDFIIEDVTEKINAVIDYNDRIVDFAEKCVSSEDAIRDAYTNDILDIEGIKSTIDDALKECNYAITKIEDLWDWEWDATLKDGVITLLQRTTEYYKKLWESVSYLNPEWLTEEEAAAYEALKEELSAIREESENANNNLASIQRQFATNHGFELAEPEWEEVAEEVVEEVVAE